MAEIDMSKYQLSDDGEYLEIRPEILPIYKASLKVQTDSWLAGLPQHNTYWDECCPDGSCCGEPMWPYELRVKFLEADEATQINMCMSTVDALLEKEGITDVYITTLNAVDETKH